ncbi:Carbonic anhydrase [Burkholderia sp. YR290]|nr:Carbonic anhydrase [Burkholderia sp. YR290]
MFVHRNIANLVVQTDMNLLSVLQYAIDVLKVNHLIVCGHYGCGGMKAALSDAHHGPIDNRLRTVKDTQQYFRAALAALDEHARFDRTVELNVIELVYNLGKTNIVRRRGETAGGRIYTAGGRSASRIHPTSDERDQQRRGGSNHLQSPHAMVKNPP